jgi:hypothetical protein
MEDGLPPGRATLLGHDRADDVNELREAGDLDAVAVVHQRDQGAADDQRVFVVVDFLDQARRDGPAGLAQIFDAARLVPDVPFVEGEHDALGRTLARGDRVGDGDGLLDEVVGQLDVAEVLLGRVVRV